MVLSVSRRTDIPCCYPDWFYRRLEEGTVCLRNPFRPDQISEIAVTPDVTDCIVFWTKNPGPMLAELEVLEESTASPSILREGENRHALYGAPLL